MERKPERKTKSRGVRLKGDKQTLLLKPRCGGTLKIHYRTFRKGGKVYRVLTGPFIT